MVLNAIGDLLKDSEAMVFEIRKRLTLMVLSKFSALKRAATEKQAELDECLQEKKRLVERKTKI